MVEDHHIYDDVFNVFSEYGENVIVWDPLGLLNSVDTESIFIHKFRYVKGWLQSSYLSGDIIVFTNDVMVSNLLFKQLKDVTGKSDVVKYYDSWQPLFQELFISADVVIPHNIDKALAEVYKFQVFETDMIEEKCFGLSNSFVKAIKKDYFVDFCELRKFVKENGRNNALLMDCYISCRSTVLHDFAVDDKLVSKFLIPVFFAVAHNGRKNILYVIHADFHEMAENNVGGTQYHLKDLVTGISSVFNVYVLAKDQYGLRLTCYSGDIEQSSVFAVNGDNVGNLKYKKIYSDIYAFCLDLLNIDLVHVHHTLDMTLGVFYEAYARNIPLVFTVHDYYYLCPLVKRECNLQPSVERCNDCLRKKGKIGNEIDFWQRWYEDNLNVLRKCCRIVAPSHSAKAVFSQVFPISDDRFLVIEHGLSRQKALKKVHFDENFNVAFIGEISPSKGSGLITEMIRNGSNNITWHIFGSISYDLLRDLKKDNYIYHGVYKRDEIIELLIKSKINLVCILSFWEETYCYTLSEAILAGIPVMAVDLGAMGERVRFMKCGWLLSSHPNVEEALNKLNDIIDNRAEYESICQNIQNVELTTVSMMNEKYLKMYDEVLNVEKKMSASCKKIEESDFVKWTLLADKKDQNETELHELIALNKKIRRILDSGIGRMAKKMNTLRHRIIDFSGGC